VPIAHLNGAELAFASELAWSHCPVLVGVTDHRAREFRLKLCSEKNAAIARYSVLIESCQFFASKYLRYPPTEDELVAELTKEGCSSRRERRRAMRERWKRGTTRRASVTDAVWRSSVERAVTLAAVAKSECESAMTTACREGRIGEAMGLIWVGAAWQIPRDMRGEPTDERIDCEPSDVHMRIRQKAGWAS
jgi:hypothetical protein